MALMKSGWMWRKTPMLKRWKLNWCDLWMDGSLMFYKSDTRKDYITRVCLKNSCINVKSGLECTGVTPPDSHPKENLLVATMRDGSDVVLCANSEDEALAWKLTMMEARRATVVVYDPESDTYQRLEVDGHNNVYIAPGPGTHHVWVHHDSCGLGDDGFGESVALGLLAGMAAGAAMRSFLWMPFWFC
ncbi:pleckstrin homology domain-containing family B member 1 isoform X2 [Engraulis encrasicolus]|uniref:pleckstrin homology domain-containing family B member 1 isoform X2 n=1 Tax=Engraulis encrasicolus TaxID=184585 RepID=UPI002FCEA329